MRAPIIAVALMGALPLAACGSDEAASVTDEEAAVTTLAGAIPADSRFAAALEAAGLASLFEGPEPYTVLLPPDDALPETLPEDVEALGALLTTHILPGTILAEDIEAALAASDGGSVTLPSYGGTDLTVTRSGGGLQIAGDGEGVTLTPGTQELDDGAVHEVSGLLASL